MRAVFIAVAAALFPKVFWGVLIAAALLLALDWFIEL